MMSNNIIPLRFENDDEGRLSSRHSGAIIYPHKDYSYIFNAGDCWFCNLQPSQSANVYFAMPFKKVDEEYFRKMIEENMDHIAAIIWRDFKDEVMMSMDDYISDEFRLILKTKDEEVKILKEELATCKTNIQQVIPESDAQSYDVMRIGPITLKSDFFAEKVTVKLSPDLKRMVITNDPDGNYSVNDGMLDIHGFDAVLDFTDEYKMISRVNGNSIVIAMLGN